MRFSAARIAALVGMVLFMTACGAAEEVVHEERAAPAAEGAFLVGAYHPWWTRGAWRAYDTNVYDEVYFFSVEVDSSGAIAVRNGWPDRWFDMQRALVDRGVRVSPAVTLFSQSAFEHLFASPTATARLQESLIGLMRDSPAAGGLQIDFEVFRPVPDDVRSGFTQFVRDLRTNIDGVRPGLRLSVYVVAYDESDVYDEAGLAAAADYLVVQGYDLHSRREDRTGPVAALEGWGRRNWEAILERLDGEGVPRGKVVMSVPYFGYEWPAVSEEPGARTTGAGRTLSIAAVDTTVIPNGPPSATERAQAYGLRRDPVSGSPYYTYEDTTGWRQGWYEDAESLADKYRFVRSAGLRGVAVFPAAYGTDELSSILGRLLNAGPVRDGSR